MFDYPIDLHRGAGPLLAPLPEPDPVILAECAVALANADGGTIVLGVDALGQPLAAPDLDACHTLLDQAAARCQPDDLFGPREIVETSDGPRLAQRIRRTGQVHALDDGRVLLRAGTHNRPLNGREIRALISLRTIGDFDAADVPGATLDDLDETLVRDFARQRPAHSGTRWHGTFADLLMTSGALRDDYRVTVAGMLLFGRDPQHWLPHSRTQFQHFTGQAHNHPVLAADIAVEGALTRVIDRTTELVATHMRTRTITGAITADYDPAIVRAALVNAVTHRDYRLRQGPVTVRLYADRLVITSPGDPAPVLTWDTSGLPCERFSVNPRLAYTLHQWGYSGFGTGLREIHAALSAQHLRPTVTANRQGFTLTIPAIRTQPPTTGPSPQSDDTAAHHTAAQLFTPNDRQQRALSHVETHGSITPVEFYALCREAHNVARRELLQQELDALVKQGRLTKIDARGGSYYIAR